jgi:beta-amylase
VYVTLPAELVAEDGKVRRIKVLTASLRALVTAGVEGVVMEIWWGIVEREKPRV